MYPTEWFLRVSMKHTMKRRNFSDFYICSGVCCFLSLKWGRLRRSRWRVDNIQAHLCISKQVLTIAWVLMSWAQTRRWLRQEPSPARNAHQLQPLHTPLGSGQCYLVQSRSSCWQVPWPDSDIPSIVFPLNHPVSALLFTCECCGSPMKSFLTCPNCHCSPPSPYISNRSRISNCACTRR